MELSKFSKAHLAQNCSFEKNGGDCNRAFAGIALHAEVRLRIKIRFLTSISSDYKTWILNFETKMYFNAKFLDFHDKN